MRDKLKGGYLMETVQLHFTDGLAEGIRQLGEGDQTLDQVVQDLMLEAIARKRHEQRGLDADDVATIERATCDAVSSLRQTLEAMGYDLHEQSGLDVDEVATIERATCDAASSLRQTLEAMGYDLHEQIGPTVLDFVADVCEG